jgi:hypothetical protein
LVKIYHPDQDGSLDAEIKYREIQTAYSILRGQNASFNNPHPKRENKRRTAGNPSDGSGRRSGGKHDANFGAEDLSTDGGASYSPRIPFSWEKLPPILRDSLKESIGFGLVVRTCLCIRILWILFRTPLIPQLLGLLAIPCLLTGCLIFRYYNVKAAREKFFLIASVGGAIAASLCYALFIAPPNRRLGVGNVFFVTLVSLTVLWVKVKLHSLAALLWPRIKRPNQR